MLHSLVTGASRGIGRAIAVALSARGDRVAVHYGRDRSAAEETLARLHGDGHVLVEGDVSDPATAERIVQDVLAAFGRIDVLVNNAALAPNPSTSHPVATVDYATWHRTWERMVQVDLQAPANLSFLVARALIERGLPGAIVNVGSRGAFRGEPDFPAYGAAKAGLHAMGQSLAVALAPHGIAVTSVAPRVRRHRSAAGEADRGGGRRHPGSESLRSRGDPRRGGGCRGVPQCAELAVGVGGRPRSERGVAPADVTGTPPDRCDPLSDAGAAA